MVVYTYWKKYATKFLEINYLLSLSLLHIGGNYSTTTLEYYGTLIIKNISWQN